MTTAALPPTGATPGAPYSGRRRLPRGSLAAQGEPMVWLTGGALALALAMIGGLLLLIVYNALGTFWPLPVVEFTTLDGSVYMGEVTRHERFPADDRVLARLTDAEREQALWERDEYEGQLGRWLVRTGNFDLTNSHFTWIEDYRIAAEGIDYPDWATVVERLSWGRFYGFPAAFRIDGQTVANTADESWRLFVEHHAACRARWHARVQLELHDMGRLNAQLEAARLRLRRVELRSDRDTAEWTIAWDDAQAHLVAVTRDVGKRLQQVESEIADLNRENARYRLVMSTADGQTTELALDEIVRAYQANMLSTTDKLTLYLARWWEFLTDNPREANSEGGVYPAIFGTVVMTLIMSVAVVPFGVLAALYLREYAKAGWIVSIVRISINNLAGVPSIVFGVFGLGFFCYGVGSWIDRGAETPWSSGGWGSAALAWLGLLLAAVFCSLVGTSLPDARHSRMGRTARAVALALWLAAFALGLALLIKSPYFHGFFPERLPNPTYGKGAVVWASLTLALLTLPVVIVATEEALAAVPNSMREGSYACGASKWQTIYRILLPRALPGIMTGMILAMARGAGEVAPLMLVGAVKLAKELPIDGMFPYIHPERSFMHLGFHIYDLGFQSQNSEAARPIVYTTTLLLITIIAVLNLVAIWVRGRLRKRFATSQF